MVAAMLGVGPGALAYSGNPNYTDISSLTPLAQRAIVTLYQDGIMNGTAPGKFSPYLPITRAQAVKFVVNALRLPNDRGASQTFGDVGRHSQYYGRIESAQHHGLLNGMVNGHGDFYPSTPITRVAFATLATNALGDQALAQSLAGNTTKFPKIADLSTLSAAQIGDVDAMMEVGIVPPYNATSFAPTRSMNREEFAVALYRLFNLLQAEHPHQPRHHHFYAVQPAAASLSAAASTTDVNTADQLTLAVTDAHGNAIPSWVLAKYTIAYTVAAANSTTTATDGSVSSSDVFTATAAGAYTVNVSISGGRLPQPITASVTITVVSLAASTTTLASSANPSVSGQSVTLTATVAPSVSSTTAPTGTVAFANGGTAISGCSAVTIASGTATCTTSFAGVSSNAITATYSGDSNYAGSSASLTQTVNQAATTTAVTSSQNPAHVGQCVIFTATISVTAPGAGAPTGTVTFMDGTTTLGTGTVSTSSSGVTSATFSTTTLPAGPNAITAVYGGDTNFTGSTSAALNEQVFGGQGHHQGY
jgi:hypothetical protein